MKETLKRRCLTPQLLRVNGYEYSFRNSLEEMAGSGGISFGQQMKKRDHTLEELGDTPKFTSKGKVFFPAERPQTAFRRPAVRDSLESFGKKRSKSEM